MQWESWQRQCERSLCTPKVAFEGRAFAHAEPARALLIPARKWSRPITVAQARAARPALSLATGRLAHELAVPLDACGAGGAGLLRCGGRRRAAALPLRRRTRPPVEAGRAVALRAHARPRPGARRVRRRSGHHVARARARAGDRAACEGAEVAQRSPRVGHAGTHAHRRAVGRIAKLAARAGRRAARRGGRISPRDRLQRPGARLRRRPVPCVVGRARPAEDAGDAARGHLRTHAVPRLRRAGLPRRVRHRRAGAEGVRRGVEHAAHSARGGRRACAAPLRDHAAHAHLPGQRGGGPLRHAGRPRRRRAAACAHRARQARAGALCAPGHEAGAALVHAVLRRSVRAAQARPVRGAERSAGRRAAVRPGEEQPRHAAQRLRHRRARDRPPVVRQPRHRGIVGRDLAQRGLRHLDGDQGDRPLQPVVGRAARATPAGRPRDGHRRRHRHPRHPLRSGQRDGGGGRVRRDHVCQGRRGAGHARAVDRPRRIPARARRVHERPAPVERDCRRPVALHRPCLGPRRGGGGRELDRSARHAARQREAALRVGPRACHAGPAALQQHRCGAGHAALADPRAPAGRGQVIDAAAVASRADGGRRALQRRAAGGQCRRRGLLPRGLRSAAVRRAG